MPGVKRQPGGSLHPPSHLKLRALFTSGPRPLLDSVIISDFLSSSFLRSLLLSLFFLLFLHFHKKQMTARKKVSCGPVPFSILRTGSSFSQGYEKALRCQVTESRASVPERMSFRRAARPSGHSAPLCCSWGSGRPSTRRREWETFLFLPSPFPCLLNPLFPVEMSRQVLSDRKVWLKTQRKEARSGDPDIGDKPFKIAMTIKLTNIDE